MPVSLLSQPIGSSFGVWSGNRGFILVETFGGSFLWAFGQSLYDARCSPLQFAH